MKLRIEHITSFAYDGPVYETATEVRLCPRDGVSDPQRRLEFRLTLEPSAQVFSYKDSYGNIVHHFNLLQSHSKLQINATMVVETGLGAPVGIPVSPIQLEDFLRESRYIVFDKKAEELAAKFSKIEDPYLRANTIAMQIRNDFVYVPGVTGVNSTSSEVIDLQQGVCQDFAHVMIAVCRVLKMPARYVSGYLYGGEETEGSDRASHAWCEVYCGPEYGWAALDPTHLPVVPSETYVKIGIGRDYDDVPPVRGTYKGLAREKLGVVVRIVSADRTSV